MKLGYDNDKYIMIFDSAKLDECIENRFEILDKIRNSRVGDGVSITASIGISRISGTLKDRENAAREAIDMALQRGGGQAVVKTEEGNQFYDDLYVQGGTTELNISVKGENLGTLSGFDTISRTVLSKF